MVSTAVAYLHITVLQILSSLLCYGDHLILLIFYLYTCISIDKCSTKYIETDEATQLLRSVSADFYSP